jgi:gliding motility-associated-like protein
MRVNAILLFASFFFDLQAATVPLVDFKYNQQCIGDTTYFSDLSCCNIDIWEWDFGDPASGINNKAYTRFAKHKYNNPGTYTVTLKVGTGSVFTDTVTRQVVICVPDKPDLIFYDSSICNGSKILLYPKDTFDQYYWSTGDTSRVISIDDPGMYVLCTTNCDSNCLLCDTAFVNLLSTPLPSLGKYTTTCNRDSVQLNARNNGFKYLWSTGDTTQRIWVKNDGVYFVKIYNSSCSISDSTYVIFARKLTIGFNTDTGGCIGDTLYLNPGWQFNQVWWNGTDTNHVLKVYTSGIYPLRIYYLGCYIDTFAIVNFVAPDTLKLPNDTALCYGDTLEVSTTVKATRYFWSNGDTTNFTKVYDDAELILTVHFGGCYQSDTMVVRFWKKPLPASLPPLYTCYGVPGVIAITMAPGNSLLWWDGSGNKVRAFPDTGWHSFRIFNSCFSTTDSVYTGFYPRFSGDSIQTIPICLEADTLLTLTANPGVSYVWRPGNMSTASIEVKKYGWYSVTVIDSGGCRITDSFNVVRQCSFDTLFIPNAFSPNKDGHNEVFKPTWVRHVNYELRIYDRWGELLFKTTNMDEGWDGKYRSVPAAEDVYIYIMEVSGYGQFRQLKGTFHLIR